MTACDKQQFLLINGIADSNGQNVDAHLENLRHRLPDNRFLMALTVRDDDDVLLRRLDRERALFIREDVLAASRTLPVAVPPVNCATLAILFLTPFLPQETESRNPNSFFHV